MPQEDEWTATPPPAPVFPRELRVWALTHYARFGTWPSPIADHPIAEDLGTAAMRARAFYLSTVKPVEEQASWSEWGLVPPGAVSPRPTFAPFVPAPHQATATGTSTESDPRGTSHAMHAAPESDDPSDS
jgi:hypothetical protein